MSDMWSDVASWGSGGSRPPEPERPRGEPFDDALTGRTVKRPRGEPRGLEILSPHQTSSVIKHFGPAEALAACRTQIAQHKLDILNLMKQMRESGVSEELIQKALGSGPSKQRAICCDCGIPCHFYFRPGDTDFTWSPPICQTCALLK